jgi:hypothetical protein
MPSILRASRCSVRSNLTSLATWLAVMSCARVGAAWYFPEHAELTRLALRDFAPHFATDALRVAVTDARETGLRICPETTTALHAVPVPSRSSCVSYSVLAALAADHANTTEDLAISLSKDRYRLPPMSNLPLAILLTDAARDTWDTFTHRAEPDAIRVWTTEVSRLSMSSVQSSGVANPRDFVRTLDAELLVIDTEYVTRAKGAKTHFHDPTSSLRVVLQQAALGELDNVLAQVLAHHARSLQLAWRAHWATSIEDRRLLRREALLEHAFALHFIEDAFAAGHVATDPAVAADERRAERHDYFNRQGLALTRAMSPLRCDSQPTAGPSQSMEINPCWVAHGDGFATSEDRLYVGEAVARLQTQFALALSPVSTQWIAEQSAAPACRDWVSGGRPEEGCDLAWTAMLLDPNPPWVRGGNCAKEPVPWATDIVTRHAEAVARLGSLPLLAPASAGTPRGQPGTLRIDVIGAPLDQVEGKSCLYSDFRATLWRPILAVWPVSQADVATLAGSDVFHRGLQLQIVASALTGFSDAASQERSIGFWGGLGAGMAFAARGIFPHRGSRTFIEGNIGFAQGYLLGTDESQLPSLLAVEVRVPVTTLALYGLGALWRSRWPLTFLGSEWSAGLMGMRAYWSTADHPQLVGWDAEVVNVFLGDSESRSPTDAGVLDAELRLRLGTRTADLNRLDFPFGGSFFVAVEVSSGYYQTIR